MNNDFHFWIDKGGKLSNYPITNATIYPTLHCINNLFGHKLVINSGYQSISYRIVHLHNENRSPVLVLNERYNSYLARSITSQTVTYESSWIHQPFFLFFSSCSYFWVYLNLSFNGFFVLRDLILDCHLLYSWHCFVIRYLPSILLLPLLYFTTKKVIVTIERCVYA